MGQRIERGTAVTCKRFPGVACRFVKHEQEWDDVLEEWVDNPLSTMCYIRMVGDDHKWLVTLDSLRVISEEDFCGECGQLGCMHGRPAS